jgi:hypothetical protein
VSRSTAPVNGVTTRVLVRYDAVVARVEWIRGAAIGAVLALLPRSASGQTLDHVFVDPNEVTVELSSSERDSALTLFSRGARVSADRPLFRCPEPPCFVRLAPAEYRLHVAATGGTTSGTADLTLSASSVVRVEPWSDARRALALTAAIAGSILAGVGLSLVTLGQCHDCASESDERAGERRGQVGLVMFAVGAPLAVLGWIDFASTRNPRVDVLERATIRDTRRLRR